MEYACDEIKFCSQHQALCRRYSANYRTRWGKIMPNAEHPRSPRSAKPSIAVGEAPYIENQRFIA